MNNEFIRGHRLESYICDDLILKKRRKEKM